MARLYADEDFRLPVVEGLRRLGHDVLTVQEAGRGNQGIDDATVLADAIADQRAVLTHNHADFKSLHRQGLPPGASSPALTIQRTLWDRHSESTMPSPHSMI